MASHRKSRGNYGGHPNHARQYRSSRSKPEALLPPEEMDAADFINSKYARLSPEFKYKNKKTTVFGIDFDSKAEARRYIDLTLMKEAGEIISDIELQPSFDITIPGYDGEQHVLFRYVADFRYTLKDGTVVINDQKGAHTKIYLMKRKAMRIQHGINVVETYAEDITPYDI